MAERQATTSRSDGSGSSERDRAETGHDERRDGHSSRSRGGRQLTAAKAARMGLQQVAEVTGREADGVAEVEPSEDGWVVGVEVVEDRRIPSSTDVLAIYQAELDHGGELVSYRRIKRYKRGQGDTDYGGESWVT